MTLNGPKKVTEDMVRSEYGKEDASYVEKKQTRSDAAVRAIREAERVIRETSDPEQRRALEEYWRQLKRKES